MSASRPSIANPDHRLMRQALAAARRAGALGEVPVGAVVARAGKVLGRGGNATLARKDPSAHAEIVALRRAARAAGNHRLAGATVYVTLEPCIMCMGAMIQARIDRLVFAAEDPKSGAASLVRSAAVAARSNHTFRIEGGLMEEAAGDLLRTFFRQRRRGGKASEEAAGKRKGRHRAP